MFTARETIRPIVTSETSDCTPIVHLGHRAQRHRVGGRERGGVSQRHVQVVDELRPPERRLDAVVAHLREQEVRAPGRARPRACPGRRGPSPSTTARRSGSWSARSACPRRSAGGRLPIWVAVQQEVGERAQRVDVGSGDECRQPERDPPAARVLVLELDCGVAITRPSSSTPSSAGTSHVGPTVSRSGSDNCKPDRGKDGQLRRPERLACRRRRVGAAGLTGPAPSEDMAQRVRLPTRRRTGRASLVCNGDRDARPPAVPGGRRPGRARSQAPARAGARARQGHARVSRGARHRVSPTTSTNTSTGATDARLKRFR